MNHPQLKQILEKHYAFDIVAIQDAPRQFVSETFIIETPTESYFCKVTDKQLFIPKIKHSLPILDAIFDAGFPAINYPIRTRKQALYVEVETYLVVVFNYINAPQSYEYDHYTFGQLNAQVHALTPQIPLEIDREEFSFPYQALFEVTLQNILTKTPVDEIAMNLKSLIQNYEAEIQADLRRFYGFCERLRAQEWEFVITHGDAPGNTLVQSPHKLYLIDWDDILLAPPERDIWLLAHSQEFLTGYKSAVPNFQIRPELFQYYVYRRYFDDMLEYFVEILGDFSESHRQANLASLQRSCFDEWLLPMIRKFPKVI